MRLITTRDRIRTIADRWHQQYDGYAGGVERFAVIADKLDALNGETATAGDVRKIIGNDSWTELRCEVCAAHVGEAVAVRSGDDYGEILLCQPCTAEAMALFPVPPLCLPAECAECGGTGKIYVGEGHDDAPCPKCFPSSGGKDQE